MSDSKRKIVTAPATRRELLTRFREIRRLAEGGADPETDPAILRGLFRSIINHCHKGKRQLEPWRFGNPNGNS